MTMRFYLLLLLLLMPLPLRAQTTPPAAPTNLYAIPGTTTMTVGWTPSANASSYKVYRSGTSTPFSSGPSFYDSGLAPTTTYTYTVTAVNAYGESAQSAPISAQTNSTLPTVPAILRAVPGNATVSLYWTPVSGVKYNLFRNTGGQPFPIAVNLTSNSYTDSAVTNGQNYHYQVTSVITSGQAGSYASASATPNSPVNQLPAPLLIVTAGTGSNALQWSGVSNAAVGSAQSYNLYRSTTSGGEGQIPYQAGIPYSGPMSSDTDSGLTAGTYYYQVAGVGSNGEGLLSQEFSGTPGATLPGAITLKAVAGNGSVALTWGAVANARGYDIYRSNGSQPILYKVGVSGTTFTDSGLSNGTAYYYTVYASRQDHAGQDTQGASGSNQASATPAAIITPLTAPLLAVTAGSGSNALQWTPVTNATTYNLYRSTTAGGEGAVSYKVGITPAGAMVTFTDSSLSAGTYYYQVAPVGVNGESTLSAEVSGTPGATLLNGPNLKAVAGNATVTLTWAAVPGATSYNLYHSNGQPVLFKSGVSGTTYTDSGLTNGTSFSYAVYPVRQDHVSQDSQGNGSNIVYATPSATITPLTAPLLSVTAGSGSDALQWMPVTNATSYNIYRSTTPGGEGAAPYKVGIMPAGPMIYYTDPPTGSLSPGTYYYQVAPVGVNGEGPLSAEASATPGVALLPAPTGVVVRSGIGKLSVQWKAVTHAVTYNVYRTVGGPGQPILYKVGITGTALLDTGLTNGTMYYYQIAAVDADGQGQLSSPVSGIPSAAALPATLVAATAVANGKVTLTWNASSGATGYNIYRVSAPGTEGGTSPAAIGTSQTGLINMTDPFAPGASGATYYYQIAPVSTAGEGILSNEASATPYITPPPVLLSAPTQYSASASSGQVVLNWNAIPGATSYNVYRISPGITQLVQTDLTGTSYTDIGLANDNTFHYQIAAVRRDGAKQDGQGNLSSSILLAVPDATLTLAPPTASPSPAAAMQTITFTTSAAGSGTITYNWNFGDSGTATSATATHIYTSPGIYFVTVTASNGTVSTEDAFTVLVGIDMVADTNRDGVIDVTDELGKGVYTKTRGAIFSVNYDNDDGRTSPGSDPPAGTPIPDGIYFDDTGAAQLPNNQISTDADTKDIAPLKIRSLGAALPAGMHLFLKAANLQDIQAVYIYKNLAAGQTAIWGGPGESRQQIEITPYVSATGDDTFGVEGLFFENDGALTPTIPAFNGLVTLTLELQDSTGKALVDDTVQMKVAPWLILPDSQPSTEVWAEKTPGYNDAFIASLMATGQLQTVPYNATNNSIAGSQWFMDHLKIGYTQRPGGPQSYEVYRLPYLPNVTPQPLWPLDYLMKSNVGTFQIGGDLGANPVRSGDFGGNLGALSPTPTAPLGKIVMGNTHSMPMSGFLKAQGVQPFVELPTLWLEVGHIDEVIGFVGPTTIAIADPVDAYNLLSKLPGYSVFFSTDTTPPVSGSVSTAAPAGTYTLTIPAPNPAWSGDGYIRIYSGTGAGQTAHFTSIVPSGSTATVTVNAVWNTGSKIVDGNNNTTPCMAAYELINGEIHSQASWANNVATGDGYVIVKGTQWWGGNLTGTPALVTVQEVLADANLKQINTVDVPTQTQIIESILSQAASGLNLNFVSVPTIYIGKDANFTTDHRSVAFTPGLANVQEIGSNLYFPAQFGPLDTGGHDVFQTETLQKFPNAVFVDDWQLYHALTGEVHCGTAMKRQPFSFNWWQNQP